MSGDRREAKQVGDSRLVAFAETNELDDDDADSSAARASGQSPTSAGEAERVIAARPLHILGGGESGEATKSREFEPASLVDAIKTVSLVSHELRVNGDDADDAPAVVTVAPSPVSPTKRATITTTPEPTTTTIKTTTKTRESSPTRQTTSSPETTTRIAATTNSTRATRDGADDDEADLCKDRHDLCKFWSSIGECESNKAWMTRACPISCDKCNGERDFGRRSATCRFLGSTVCIDRHRLCSFWASLNECETNKVWMLVQCAKSCKSCKGESPSTSVVF